MTTNRKEVRDVRQLVALRGNDGQVGDNDGKILTGYAARFDEPYACFDPFFSFDVFDEIIDRNAFSRALKENPDIRALRNHDPDLILGRTKAGTLRLMIDSTGLAFEATLPDTTVGRDTREDVRNGNIDGCSWMGIVRGQKVDRSNKARVVRTITDIDLIEITPACTFPMNEATSVSVRHLDVRASLTPRLDMARRLQRLIDSI